jgi:hypothetical protein
MECDNRQAENWPTDEVLIAFMRGTVRDGAGEYDPIGLAEQVQAEYGPCGTYGWERLVQLAEKVLDPNETWINGRAMTEIREYMRKALADQPDANFDASDLAAEACSCLGLFSDNPDESIPRPVLEYALELLPDEDPAPEPNDSVAKVWVRVTGGGWSKIGTAEVTNSGIKLSLDIGVPSGELMVSNDRPRPD